MSEEAFATLATDSTTDVSGDNGATGWQEESPPCKRHSYKGGDVCLKCGTPKPVHTPRTPRVVGTDEESGERLSPSVRMLRTALSGTWMAMGVGCTQLAERQPSVHYLAPVGRVMQFEAAIAGPRIQRALRKTPLWKPIMAMMKQVGPWADLAPLIGPPILVGLMASNPKLRDTLAMPLVAMLTPLVAETAKMAEDTTSAMQLAETFSEENKADALQLVSFLFQDDENES